MTWLAPVANLGARARDRWVRTFATDDTHAVVKVAGGLIITAVAYVVLVEGLLQGMFGHLDLGVVTFGPRDRPIPRAIFVNGMVIGSLYALIGIGIILVYRANRIVNFAQAQLGAVPASAALMLLAFRDWPYIVAVPIVLVGGALIGGLVEVLFIRRFASSPRLILTVVTIGVGLVLQALEFFTKRWIVGDQILESLAAQFTTPWNRFQWQYGPLTFTGDHLFTVATVVVLAGGLAAFFKYTDIGIAVRASAENLDRASLLGIPVKRVSTVVWVLAAVLSSVGVFLRAPLFGLPITGFIGPTLLLYGLGAAVIARMEHTPTAVVAGMFIGIVEGTVVFSVREPTLVSPIILVVIVIALLLQRGILSRAFESGASSWQASRDLRPIPAELRDHPAVRRARVILATVGGLAVLATPWVVGDAQIDTASRVAIFSIIGVSLVVLTGWTGQISLGQFGIAGVGAAVAGGLASNHQTDFFVTLIVAGLVGAVVAVLIGLPALRIQGLFLAVTTLAFAFAVPDFLLRRDRFGWLLPGLTDFVERPVLYGAFDMTKDSRFLWFNIRADAKFFYLCVVFLGLALYLARSLRRYRSGRVLIGIRDNPRMMQAFGVNLARTRLGAFAISGFMAAVGGALFAYQFGQIDSTAFLPEKSIQIFLMTVIGGVSSLPGAVIGAVYVLMLPLLPVLRDIQLIDLLTSGIGVLIILQTMPGGLIEGVYNIRDSWLRRLAHREGIHVPSLVADSLVDAEAVKEQDRLAARAAATADAELEPLPDDALVCPVCSDIIPLAEARSHPHLAPPELVAPIPGAER
ncbi:MAG TPA: ABC transporter permease [Acidimicrobiales bacterium]